CVDDGRTGVDARQRVLGLLLGAQRNVGVAGPARDAVHRSFDDDRAHCALPRSSRTMRSNSHVPPHCSTILSSSIRQISTWSTVIRLPVAGTPRNSAVCVPVVRVWLTTRSPSATSAICSEVTSENAGLRRRAFIRSHVVARSAACAFE